MLYNQAEAGYQAGGSGFAARFLTPGPNNPPAPPVLLLPEFTGPGPYLMRHAKRLAAKGHPVLVADLYSKDESPACHGFDANQKNNSREKCLALARRLGTDRRELRLRVMAALDELLRISGQDQRSAYVLGFSFGGMAALELARMGAGPSGVISVYGRLGAAPGLKTEKLRARLLIIQGLEDKVAPMGDLAGLSSEMERAGAEPEVLILGYAGHGFMNRYAAPLKKDGAFYSPRAEARAWAAIDGFMSG